MLTINFVHLHLDLCIYSGMLSFNNLSIFQERGYPRDKNPFKLSPFLRYFPLI